jgi:hypothetical protein
MTRPVPDRDRVAPVRIQLSRARGFDLQAASRAVKVDRSTRWGNPFVVGKPSGCFADDGPLIAALSLEQAVGFYADMVRGFLSPEMYPAGHEWIRKFQRHFHGMHPADAARCYLRDRNLGCWCPLDRACHCDPLLRIANR